MSTLQDDLIALARVKQDIAALTDKKAEIEAMVMAAMEKNGQKTAQATNNGGTVKATVVAPQRVVIDEDKIKAALEPRMWRKVTRQVLDKERLEAAVSLGEVDANVVAACSEVKDTKPYVKVTGDVQTVVASTPKKKVVRAKPRSSA